MVACLSARPPVRPPPGPGHATAVASGRLPRYVSPLLTGSRRRQGTKVWDWAFGRCVRSQVREGTCGWPRGSHCKGKRAGFSDSARCSRGRNEEFLKTYCCSATELQASSGLVVCNWEKVHFERKAKGPRWI